MADMYDKAKRSQIMAAVKHKNSKAELMVFAFLNKRRIYYQKHYKRIIGTPDIALPRKKKAVFIDGDFWHGRTLNSFRDRRGPDDYWVTKMEDNIKRDAAQMAYLKQNGWSVLRIWESDLKRVKTRETVLNDIANFLTD